MRARRPSAGPESAASVKDTYSAPRVVAAPILVTIEAAAEILAHSKSWVERKIRANKIAVVRFGGRGDVRIEMAELQRFVAAQRRAS